MGNLTISIDEAKVNKDLTELAEKKYRELGQQMLREHFNQRHRQGWPQEEDGEGTKFVRDIVEGLLLDDKFKEKVTRFVEKHWDTILEEACVDAMRHKARAIAFNAEGIKSPRVK